MLKTRIITAFVLIAGFLWALYGLPLRGWMLFTAVILAAAAWEWAALIDLPKWGGLTYSAAVAAISLWIIWPADGGPGAINATPYVAAAFFWIVVAPLWMRRNLSGGSTLLLACCGWVALAPCFFALVHLRTLGPTTLLFYMGIVWIADTAAYFSGRKFGRHKLAPTISPGKTWEGVAGALLAASAYGLLWTYGVGGNMPKVISGSPAWLFAMLIFLWSLTGLGVCGDLFESALKRRAGVKDSGSVLPGHGGVLDRIDALLPVLPLAALVFLI
jgi:phosphatidate cytidylyltransferase